MKKLILYIDKIRYRKYNIDTEEKFRYIIHHILGGR